MEIWGQGNREQNFIHISDACNFLLKSIQNFDSVQGEILLCTSDKEHSNNTLAHFIANYTMSRIAYVNEDNSVSLNYNNELSCKLLNWEPKVNLESEIINYIEWKKQF